MTGRELIIELLKNENINLDKKVIIKALEQQPCDDCVSRQAALDAITKIHPVDTEYDCTLYDKVDVMYVLKALPPVTSQPKSGHWIKYGMPRCGEQHYQCTSCGYYVNFGQWGELYTKEFKYCPNCGAKMQEVEENG